MTVAARAAARTRNLAAAIWVSVALLPFAAVSYGLPQWALLASQGPCIARGDEWWYQVGRLIGGLALICIAILAIAGIVRGRPARVVGVVALVAAFIALSVVGFIGYAMFHLAEGICT